MLHPFYKIINANYSDTEIGMYGWWADELCAELDNENVERLKENFVDDDQLSIPEICDQAKGFFVNPDIYDDKVYNWEVDNDVPFDFPDPPEISI